MVTIVKKQSPNIKESVYSILDVGSGAGVLIPYIQNSFNPAILHAIDLSQKQLNHLQSRYPHVKTHRGDISLFQSNEKFHCIFCNACFGNFYSQTEALSAMAELLYPEGLIGISHPLGAQFVAQLHLQDRYTVPHPLPDTLAEIQQLCQELPLKVVTHLNEKEFYLLILQKIA